MRACTIIAAMLLATAASGQSFLDQLCDGTSTPEGDSSYRPANIKAYVESYLDCLESERMRDLHANYEYPNDDGSITYIYGDVHAHLDADCRVTHLQPGMNGRDNQYRPDWAENEEKVSCQ